MGRKEADILQLISRVVSLQRDMLRPRAVPIIRHTRFAIKKNFVTSLPLLSISKNRQKYNIKTSFLLAKENICFVLFFCALPTSSHCAWPMDVL